MADVSKTIEIIFAGTDNLSGSLDNIGSKLNTMGTGLQDIGAPFADATKKILLFEAALAALAVGGLFLAFNASSNFENSVIELRKVLGEGISTEEAEANAIRLSEVYGESANSILLSTADFKQAGFDIEDAMILTAASMDLVIAGGLETALASDLIVAALKGFGEEASETSRFIDILNEVSNNYATDVENLAVGMSKISPVAEAMGFSMEETAGVLTPVIEIFRSGDQAAIALKTGLLKLLDDSKPVADALKNIGVSQRDSNGALKSGKEIFYEVSEAFKDLDENEKLFITTQLVGIHQAAKMVVVFDNLNKVQEITTVAMGASGSAALEVAERLKSAEVSVAIFKTSFENLSTAVGNQFRLAAQEAIDGGSKISQALSDAVSDGSFDSVFDLINKFGSDLGASLSLIAENLPEALEGVDFDDLISSFEGVVDSIQELFSDMDIDLTTVDGLEDAIQLVVDSIASLQNLTGGIVSSFTLLISSIKDVVDWFGNLDEDTQKLIGELTGFGAQLTIVGGILTAGGAVVAGIGALSGLLSAGGLLATGITGIVALLTGPVGLVVGLGALAAAVINFSFDSMNEEHEAFMASMELSGQAIAELYEQITNIPTDVSTIEIYAAVDSGDLVLAQELIDKITSETYEANLVANVEQEEFDDFWTKLSNLPAETQTEILALMNAGDMEAVEEFFTKLEVDKIVNVIAEADIESAKEDLSWFDEEGKEHSILVDVESTGIDVAKEKIEEIPTEKMLEIRLQGDIAVELENIKNTAETMQSAFEWNAKLEIAEVEAQAQVIESAYESINTSILSTADLIGSSLEVLGDPGNASQKFAAVDILRDEADLRQKSFELQEKLTNEQVKYMAARTAALESGDSEIKISSDGLEPALEMVMWQILEKVQLRANAQASDFLLGL